MEDIVVDDVLILKMDNVYVSHEVTLTIFGNRNHLMVKIG